MRKSSILSCNVLTTQDPDLKLEGRIFLEDPKSVKAEHNAPRAGTPGPIHLVRRGDYLCELELPKSLTAGGLIREYEENRRLLLEQEVAIQKLPVKEGFGLAPSRPSSPPRGKSKRRKTPEYTDSEEEAS